MFHIVLFEPEIPPNTGNIIRLCANTGVELHLIHPLGFELDNRQLRRAGLDYDEFTNIQEYRSVDEFISKSNPKTIYAASTKGKINYTSIKFFPGDAIVFGPETRGLPGQTLATFPSEKILRIPMQQSSRSLNLSNAVAVIVYEALRQNGFQFDADN